MENTLQYLKPKGRLVIVDPDPSKIGDSDDLLTREKIQGFAARTGYTTIEVDDSYLQGHMIIVLTPDAK